MTDIYQSPLSGRYSSNEMLALFSADTKFKTWRKLWLALAKSEQKLGLPITDLQIKELESHLDDIDYKSAQKWEKDLRHDVMAHIHAWGEQCPNAMPIIHLGATSCFVGDNTDIILMKQGLEIIRKRIVAVLRCLAAQADKYKALPTLGFTHFQPAQLVTVGKRMTLWANSLLSDLEEVEFRISRLKLRGVKGTTGTQASFLELFEGDHKKVCELEKLVCEEMGFSSFVPVCGQTYDRKTDYDVLSTLSAIAQSASKFANDFRLLSHLKEIEEPFEGKQIGSSAMPYKRNPMRTERICSLSRIVMAQTQVASETASTQWFERTLDDSAAKRIAIPESFLATDAILLIYANVVAGLKVYPKVIENRIFSELPFMATENIMMQAVKQGGDRQELHEKIRLHSLAAGAKVKEDGEVSDLPQRIAADPSFGLTLEEIKNKLKPELYIGRSKEQTQEFLQEFLLPTLAKYKTEENFEELKV